MIILLYLTFVLLNLYISVNCTDVELFVNIQKKYYQINDSIIISCRTKDSNYNDFLYKKKEKILVYKCNIYDDNSTVSCGHVHEWYYKNITLPAISWQQRGQYQCIINQVTKSIYINMTAPPQVKMSVTHVSYKSKSERNADSSTELRGTGQPTRPYDLRNLNIKSIEITCSANCSFPVPIYLWQISKPVTTQGTNMMLLNSLNADNVTCNGSDSEGMARSSSLVNVDCFEQQLTGVQLVECRALTNHPSTQVVKRAYVFCPEGEYVTKSNGSRLVAKNLYSKVTTGEMINIVVGCSIGVILLISGIIMICKHRTKDDIGQYTMRQNSIDHSGYRV